jgi:pimeloyl-ACP methyl ester carboxylesterase
LLKMLLPVVGLVAAGLCAAALYLGYAVTRPPAQAYMLTPEGFIKISTRGVKATDETWANPDGTRARGWLLRGDEGAPAVVLLHAYGSDRSSLLNLGVKLNEATNFTILWPDLRGHGERPPVSSTTFGAREAEDLGAALAFLRTLKTQRQRPLVGGQLGVYGVELGAYAALLGASRGGAGVRALVLDSVPAAPDQLLHSALAARTGVTNGLARSFARTGTRILLLGGYENAPACGLASGLRDAQVLLLTGEGAGPLRTTTQALAQCFPADAPVEIKDDLPVTGIRVGSSTAMMGETYDLLVIDFFTRTLKAETMNAER